MHEQQQQQQQQQQMQESLIDSIEPFAASTGSQSQRGTPALLSPSVDLTLDSLDAGQRPKEEAPVETEYQVRDCNCDTSSSPALSIAKFISHRGESMLSLNASSAGTTPPTRRRRGLAGARSQSQSLRETPRNDLNDRRSRLRETTIRRDLAELDSESQSLTLLDGVASATAANDRLLLLASPNGEGLAASRLPDNARLLAPAFQHQIPQLPEPQSGRGVAAECPNCQRLRRQLLTAKEEAAAQQKQLLALRDIVAAVRNGDARQGEAARADENAALVQQVSALRSALAASFGEGEDEAGSLDWLRRELERLVETERRRLDAEAQEQAARSQQLQQQAEAAAQLSAMNAELDERARLLGRRCQELEEELAQLREANAELTLSLGRVSGVLPELEPEEYQLLEARWSDLPSALAARLDDGDLVGDRVKDEEEIVDDHAVMQCLWYRLQVTRRALGGLQQQLQRLGISSANQLQQLRRLAEDKSAKAQQESATRQEVEAARRAQESLAKRAEAEQRRAAELQAALQRHRQLPGDQQLDEQKLKLLLEGVRGIQQRLKEAAEEPPLQQQHQLQQQQSALGSTGGSTVIEVAAATVGEVKELQQQLEVFRERLRMLQDENQRLKEAAAKVETLETARAERDSIAENFDRASRSWQDEKQRADRLVAELEAAKDQLHSLKSFEYRFHSADEERRGLREQLQSLTQQLGCQSSDSRDAISSKDEELRQLRQREAEASKQLLDTRQQLQSQQQRQEEAAATAEAAQRELRASQRLAEGQEADRRRLLQELRQIGHQLAAREAALLQAKEHSSSLLLLLRRRRQPDAAEAEEAEAAAERLAGTLAKELGEAGEASQSVSGLRAEFAGRDEPDSVGKELGQQLQQLLREALEANAQLRQQAASAERRAAEESKELRVSLAATSARLEDERQRRGEAAGEAERLARLLQDAQGEAKARREVEELVQQLRRDLQEASARCNSEREASSHAQAAKAQLEQQLHVAETARATAEATLQQLRSRCSELLKDYEELEKVSSVGDDKANALVTIVERLKNRVDKAALENKSLTADKLSLGERMRQLEAEGQLQRQSLNSQAERLREKLDAAKRELRSRSREVAELSEAARASAKEQQRLQERLLAAEGEAARQRERAAELEAAGVELRRRLSQLEEAEAASPRAQLLNELQELRQRQSATEAKFKEKESRLKQRESQAQQRNKQRLAEIEALLADERAQLAVAKAKSTSLEDEVEYLRKQLAKAKQATPKARSHADQVEQLIMRSQTKAQQLLQGNPELVRSFTPDSNILRSSAGLSDRNTPTGSYPNQLD